MKYLIKNMWAKNTIIKYSLIAYVILNLVSIGLVVEVLYTNHNCDTDNEYSALNMLDLVMAILLTIVSCVTLCLMNKLLNDTIKQIFMLLTLLYTFWHIVILVMLSYHEIFYSMGCINDVQYIIKFITTIIYIIFTISICNCVFCRNVNDTGYILISGA